MRGAEQEEGDPARTAVLYERAVAAFPVTAYLWAAYGRMVEERLRGVPAVVSAVYARAARNCPWVGLLWARRAPRRAPRRSAPLSRGIVAARRPLAVNARSSHRALLCPSPAAAGRPRPPGARPCSASLRPRACEPASVRRCPRGSAAQLRSVVKLSAYSPTHLQ